MKPVIPTLQEGGLAVPLKSLRKTLPFSPLRLGLFAVRMLGLRTAPRSHIKFGKTSEREMNKLGREMNKAIANCKKYFQGYLEYKNKKTTLLTV